MEHSLARKCIREYKRPYGSSCLVHGALRLGLLVADLKVLRALDGLQPNGLAVGAGQTQRDLLCSLRLLMEDGLRLPSKPSLLVVVPPLTLRHERGLAGLVLRHL